LWQRPTDCFVHNPVSHQFHIGEIPADVLNDIKVIICTIFSFVIVRLNGDTVSMLKDGIQQGPV
jgi:hypothetical protein